MSAKKQKTGKKTGKKTVQVRDLPAQADPKAGGATNFLTGNPIGAIGSALK